MLNAAANIVENGIGSLKPVINGVASTLIPGGGAVSSATVDMVTEFSKHALQTPIRYLRLL